MIKSLHIKNFKSIRETSVDFSESLNVVVGLNGAGKTSFIQTIAFIKDLAQGENLVKAIRKITTSPQELFNRNETSKELFLKIDFINTEESEYSLSLTLELNEMYENYPISVISERLEKISNKNCQIIYNRNNSKLENGEGKPIPLNVEDVSLALPLFVDQDARAAKNFLSRIYIPDSALIDSRDSIVIESTNNLAGLLIKLKNSKPDEYEKFTKITAKLIPSFSAVADLQSVDVQKISSDVNEVKHYLVLIEEKNLKGRLSMKSLSTGDIRTSFIIACTLAIKEGSVIIIEEIENGIHPKRAKDLVEYIDKIAKARDLQVIFTTHSTAIINAVRVKDIIYVEKKLDIGTKLFSFSQTEKQDRIKEILEEGGEITDYINYYSNL